ncbi:MAG: DUF5320 domain-containing protein [candidate division WS1 bacterium]|jgi:hypothetical protein|nr:DUF5320 domain-containing protein [candidate division WS1 bacterium]
MPFRDGTGPTGQGPMTGRGLGPCATSDARNVQIQPSQPVNWFQRLVGGSLGTQQTGSGLTPGGGRGAGRGRGQRRGMGRGRRGRQ